MLGIYTAWEENAFDNNDAFFKNDDPRNSTGVFVPYFYRDFDNQIKYEALIYYKDSIKGTYYSIPKETKKETVINPIKYKIGNKEIYLMSLVVPIINEKKFLGVVGVDISTISIQHTIEETKIYNGNGKIEIISDNGIIVASTKNSDLIGTVFNLSNQTLSDMIQNNERSRLSGDTIKSIIPIKFGNSTNKWFIIITVPTDYLTANVNIELIKIVVISLIFLVVLVFSMFYLVSRFLSPIHKTTRIAEKLALGNLDIWEVDSSSKEIEKLNDAFKKVVDAQKQITEVCEAVSEGNYEVIAIEKSEKDSLSRSVNLMVNHIKASTEEEFRRKWVNEGYSDFVELLRDFSDLKSIAQAALTYLIKYTNMIQGAVFVINNDENQDYLNLEASYAYSRKKSINLRIEIGEGLVGQVVLEKEMIYLTDVPQDYVNITSGLGTANPACILILPLIHNEKVEAVLEMASFLYLEDYMLEFIKRCGTSLASIISTTKINELTQKLFEESKIKTEQIKSQEEEMRQNLEELSASQEEMQRKEQEYIKKILELQETIAGTN